MPRLPQPGGDNGNWGQILNDYLSAAHNPDGSLKPNSITTPLVTDGSITEVKLDSTVRSKLNAIAGQQGATGPMGATGPQGTQGSAGPVGATGPQGIQGTPGVAGLQGATGTQGSQGIPGSTGSTGPAGTPGVAGPTGPVGPAGSTGATGPTGSTGATGPAGNDGADSTVPGPQGATGPQGPAGTSGETGATGPQGPRGTVGNAGATGAQGPQGATGPVGNAYVLGTQSGTGYTLQLADAGQFVSFTSSTVVTVTVPSNISTPFPLGTRIMLFQVGIGQVTIAAASGVTLQSDPGLKIATQYGGAELIKRATDTWAVVGRLAV